MCGFRNGWSTTAGRPSRQPGSATRSSPAPPTDDDHLSGLAEGGHELVALGSDPATGYRGIIAIQSTALGPAVGGTRWWRYRTEAAAAVDAPRLSRGMSYKNDRYHTGRHGANRGDHRVRGWPGGGLRRSLAVREYGATSQAPDRIHAARADIFAPCALGGVLHDGTIPEITAELVVGAANNQLLEPRHGHALAEPDILYLPDYVANAGGFCYGGSIEVLGMSPKAARARVDAIYDTALRVLERARADGVPPFVAADRLAEERIAAARSR